MHQKTNADMLNFDMGTSVTRVYAGIGEYDTE